MKLSRAPWLFCAALCAITPAPLIAQGVTGPVLPWTSASTGTAPKLDLIGDYGCATCSDDGSPGLIPSIRSLAAGPSSFGVLFQKAPGISLVRVWNLDTGSVTQFNATRDSAAARNPIGLTLLRDSLVVTANDRFQVFSPSGVLLGRTVLTDAAPFGGIRKYTSSPSGRWLLVPELALGDVATSVRRVDRKSGGIEQLDVPMQLVAGSTSSSPSTAQNLSAMAIADDGTVAMGNGSVAYRLMLLPADAGVRLEGGRSLPMPPLSAQQIESLRRFSPQDVERKIQAGVGHFGSDALQFDALGRLWVRATRGSNDTPVSTVFDVFSPRLEFLGEVTVDGRVGEFHFAEGLLVGVNGNGQSRSSVRVWRILER
jgi:hypothetical protein